MECFCAVSIFVIVFFVYWYAESGTRKRNEDIAKQIEKAKREKEQEDEKRRIENEKNHEKAIRELSYLLHEVSRCLENTKLKTPESKEIEELTLTGTSFPNAILTILKKQYYALEIPQSEILQPGPEPEWLQEPNFRNTKTYPPDWQWRRSIVYGRDKGKCVRCGISLPIFQMDIHHLTPLGNKGSNAIENLVTLCRACHLCQPGHRDRMIKASVQIGRKYYHARTCQNVSYFGKIQECSKSDLYRKGLFPCSSCNPDRLFQQSFPSELLEDIESIFIRNGIPF